MPRPPTADEAGEPWSGGREAGAKKENDSEAQDKFWATRCCRGFLAAGPALLLRLPCRYSRTAAAASLPLSQLEARPSSCSSLRSTPPHPQSTGKEKRRGRRNPCRNNTNTRNSYSLICIYVMVHYLFHVIYSTI